MATKSRKLLIASPGVVSYETAELPDPGPRTVRVRTIASGISHGTEMAAFNGTSPLIERKFDQGRLFRDVRPDDPPFFPYRFAGYDIFGQVLHAGEAVEGLGVGDAVYVAAPHQTVVQFEQGERDAVKLKADTTPQQAVMGQLASVALGALVDAQVKLGDRIAVIGAGTVGQLVAEIAMLDGAGELFVVEPVKQRREQAASLPGVQVIDPALGDAAGQLLDATGGHWPDCVIECSGHPAGLHTAIRMAGVGGTVIAAGFYQGGSADLRLGEEFLHNRVTVKASMWVWQCPSRFPDRWNHDRKLRHALRLIESGRLDASRYITDRVPFDDAQRAYEMIQSDPARHLRVMLTYDGS